MATACAARGALGCAVLSLLLQLGCGGGPSPSVGTFATARAAPALEAVSFAEALASGEAALTVLYVRSSGFANPGEDGRLSGVTVELLREFGRYVEERHGLAVTLTFTEEARWATFYDRVRDARGGVFGLGNVTITERRRQELAFSPPYLNNVAILMTHEEVPELDSLEAIRERFQGLRGLSYPGTLHEERIEALRRTHFPDLETVMVESNDELVQRVSSGDGFFGYIDVYNYWRAVEQGHPLRRHAVGDDASEQFGVIMPIDSDWAAVMEEFFELHGGVLGTAWYAALLREHLGEGLAGLLQGGRSS